MNATDNHTIYTDDRVVSYFERLSGIQPVEEYVFHKYVPPGASVADIGVGGGRTTPRLAPNASRYLGIDYSKAMVEACKAKYPMFEFVHGDATDLSFIPDSTFDVSVFSFNGIDCIPTDAGRIQCLREMRRVTKKNGVVIISSHNAKRLAEYPVLTGASIDRMGWRLVRAAARTPVVALRALRTKAFHEGAGYVFDPTHGGALLYASTPSTIAHDARCAGLSVVETVSGYYPARVSKYLTNWYYYVLQAENAA